MTDDLRDAARQVQAALRTVRVPDPPTRSRRPLLAASAAAIAVLVAIGGWALFLRNDAATVDAAGGGCPLTLPTGGFVPPEPWPASAPAGQWHGTAALWTDVPESGHDWFDLPLSPDGGYVQKTSWWSESFDVATEEMPAITVTARRLDGDAPVVTETPGTNAHRPDHGWWMIVGIELPTTGCWEITAEYRGAELSYVALVR